MTNRKNNSKTEPSGSIEAIMDEYPDAELVTGEQYCECKEKRTYGMVCISCKKPVEPVQPEIFVCGCEHGNQNCTCDGGQS